jgi:hypothetical protein
MCCNALAFLDGDDARSQSLAGNSLDSLKVETALTIARQRSSQSCQRSSGRIFWR